MADALARPNVPENRGGRSFSISAAPFVIFLPQSALSCACNMRASVYCFVPLILLQRAVSGSTSTKFLVGTRSSTEARSLSANEDARRYDVLFFRLQFAAHIRVYLHSADAYAGIELRRAIETLKNWL